MILKSQSKSTQWQIWQMPHPQTKNHLSPQPDTPNNRKDASITPSSRFLSFPQVSNHSSHSPFPPENLTSCHQHYESGPMPSRLRTFWIWWTKSWCFLGKIHIKSVIFSIKFAENYSSLPLLFLMYIFLFTMIIWWPHTRFCLGYLLVLLDADIFQIHLVSPCNVSIKPWFLGAGNTGPPPPILSSWLTHNPWWLPRKSKR